jgi:type VI secretion system protein ImpF
MSRIRSDQPLVPSVLYRLVDEEPGVSTEPPQSRSQTLRKLKKSVQDDLRNLLNTRWRCRELPPELTELEQSLVNYGIPDITSARLGSGDKRQEFCRIMETIIRTFLPYFQKVVVRLRDDEEPLDGTLRFRIDALLLVHPAVEQVAFIPNLELDTGNFHFEETAS